MMRYRLLGEWARERGLTALLTAHHLDDQAETLLMRLARGAGVKGLAGMRAWPVRPERRLVARFLAGVIRELEAVCAAAGDRAGPRIRATTTSSSSASACARRSPAADWLDPAALAASAAHLAEADEALDWAAELEWRRGVNRSGGGDRLQADRCAARNPPPDRPPRGPRARDRGRRRGAARPRARPDPRGASQAAARRRCAASFASAAPNGASASARSPTRQRVTEVSAIEGQQLGPGPLRLFLVVSLGFPATVQPWLADEISTFAGRRALRKAASRSGFSFGIFSASFLAMMTRYAARDFGISRCGLDGLSVTSAPGWKVATAPIRSGRPPPSGTRSARSCNSPGRRPCCACRSAAGRRGR